MFTDAGAVVTYAKGGHGHLTFVSVASGQRYTYRISKGNRPVEHLMFVSVLRGQDNTRDYTYAGTIFPDDHFRHTKNAKLSPDDKRFRTFKWVWERLTAGRIPEGVEVYHDGRCGRCGRLLTTPESVEIGLGPICAEKP